MSNGFIDQAAANYVAASDLCNPAGLVGLRVTIDSDVIVGAMRTIGRAASNVRAAGGSHEEYALANLHLIGEKLNRAYSHHQQLMSLLDELVQDFMGAQGELAGIAQVIAATGQL